jgi:hypothetical protein
MKAIAMFFVALFLPIVFITTGCKKDQASDSTELVLNVPATAKDSIPIVWNAKNADACTIMVNGNPFSQDIAGSRYYKVQPGIDTVYVSGFATKNGRNFYQDRTVRIINSGKLIFALSADRTSIGYNEIAHITIVSNADSIRSDFPNFPGTPGTFPTLQLLATVTYHFDAYKNGVDTKFSITINVTPMTVYEMITQPQGWLKPVLVYRVFPNGHRDTINAAGGGDVYRKFGTDGVCRDYQISTGNKLIGTPRWTLTYGNTILSIDVAVYNIPNITSTTMTLSHTENVYGDSNGTTCVSTYVYTLYVGK